MIFYYKAEMFEKNRVLEREGPVVFRDCFSTIQKYSLMHFNLVFLLILKFTISEDDYNIFFVPYLIKVDAVKVA